MKSSTVVIALAAVGLPVGAYVIIRRRQQTEAQAPVNVAYTPPADAVVPEFVPLPVYELPAPDGLGASPLGGAEDGASLGETIVKVVAGPIGTVGLQLLEVQQNVVEALGANEATQDAVGVFGHVATVGFVAQQGLEKLAEKVGFGEELAKDIGQVGGIGAAAAVVLGAPAIVGAIGAKLVGEGISAAIGAIAGEEAEKAVRGAVSELDPFKNGSLANEIIGGVSDFFHGKSDVPPAPPPDTRTAEQKEKDRITAENNDMAKAAAAAVREATLDKKKTGGRTTRDFQEDGLDLVDVSPPPAAVGSVGIKPPLTGAMVGAVAAGKEPPKAPTGTVSAPITPDITTRYVSVPSNPVPPAPTAPPAPPAPKPAPVVIARPPTVNKKTGSRTFQEDAY